MLVLLFPCYLGAETTWIDDLHANGVEKARAYGRFVAERFAKYPNLIWVMGGDRDPEYALAEHDALAEAIHTHDPTHLMTFHGSVHSSRTLYHNAPWLDLNMNYNYRETYVQSHEDYRRTPVKPTFMSESGYEREANDNRYGTPQRIRRQAYWTLLGGQLRPPVRQQLLAPGTRLAGLARLARRSSDEARAGPVRIAAVASTRSRVREGVDPRRPGRVRFARRLHHGRRDAGPQDRCALHAHCPAREAGSRFVPRTRACPLVRSDHRHLQRSGRKALPNRGEHWFTPPARDCDSDWVLLLESADKEGSSPSSR